MSGSNIQFIQPLAADGAVLAHVLRRAGVNRDDLIRVVGPAAPTAVLWLARKGYRDAVYAPGVQTEASGRPADALLIPHACARRELAALLDGVGGLREGGVLIFQSWARDDAAAPDGVDALVRGAGCEIEQTLLDKGRAIHIARRLAGPCFRKAA